MALASRRGRLAALVVGATIGAIVGVVATPAGAALAGSAEEVTAESTVAATPTTPVAAPATAVDVLGGHLDWGFKESFRTYIVGPIARGSITTSDGAVANGDGTFRFPIEPGSTYDHATSTTIASFGGMVSFRGHGYHHPTAGDLLQVTVSALRLEAAGPTGTLYADVVSLELEGDIANPEPGGPPVLYEDVALVTLDFNGIGPVTAGARGVQWIDVPSVLGADGAEAFAGFYPPGTPFDPVSYELALPQVPAGIPDPPPPPPPPVAAVDRNVVTAGEALTVSGDGFLAGEQVEIWLQPSGGWQATAIADASGRVEHTFVLPVTTPAGQYTVELRGISSGLAMSSEPITVLAGAPVGFGGTPLAAAPTLPATGSERDLALVGVALILVGAALVTLARRARPAVA